MSERERLIQEARRLRKEITGLFIDAASWNDNARRTGEPVIDPDPDGALRRIAGQLDQWLATVALQDAERAALTWPGREGA